MTCVDCQEDRPHKAHGLCTRCYHRWWRAENPERDRATRRAWLARQPPGYTARNLARYRSDPVKRERDREVSRRWKAANRDRNRARDRAYQARRRAER